MAGRGPHAVDSVDPQGKAIFRVRRIELTFQFVQSIYRFLQRDSD